MARSRGKEMGVGLLLIGGAALFAWMAVQVGAISDFTPRRPLILPMPDAAGIQAGAAVAVAGVAVGSVSEIRLEGGVAVAELSVDEAVTLTSGTVGRVRARSILGEKYIELTPGPADAPPLPAGASLPPTARQLEIDEVVGALSPLLEAVDAEAVADLLAPLAAAFREDPELLARGVRNLDTLLVEAAAASSRLPALLDRAERSLDRVDGAVAALGRRAAEAQAPIGRADDLLASLSSRTGDVEAGLADAAAAAREARALLEGLRGLDGDVRTVLDNFKAFDKWEARRLLREEGILIRVRPREVIPTDE